MGIDGFELTRPQTGLRRMAWAFFLESIFNFRFSFFFFLDWERERAWSGLE
jgi:hypothetical protein